MQLGKPALKQLDQVSAPFTQWMHYVASYQFKVQNDNPRDLFKVYKNGQPHNNAYAHYQDHGLMEGKANKLAFGKMFFDTNTGPYANVMLDDLLVKDGTFNDTLASELYQRY